MENYNTYGSQGVPNPPTTYASDETRQRDTQQQNTQLLYQAMRYKTLARSGANWFYWIAALSLLNSIIFFTGSNFSFFVGLGLTPLIDALLLNAQAGLI